MTGPDRAPGPSSVPAGGGPWPGEELQRVLLVLRDLGRQVDHLRGGLVAHTESLDELRQAVDIVEGRTRRHESGQDRQRDLHQAIGTLEERLNAEVAMRRELVSRLERAHTEDHASAQQIARLIDDVRSRVESAEGRQAADAERGRHLSEEIAGRGAVEQDVLARLDALERRVDAAQVAGHRSGDGVAQLTSLVPQAIAGVDEIRDRVQALHVDQRRLDDAIAGLREERDREAQLLDVIEQQRALRARLEERLAMLEESAHRIEQQLQAVDEARAALAQRQAGLGEQLRVLTEALEAQRLAMIEHLRRQVRAGEDVARRQIDAIERAQRMDRDLLVRLSEESRETLPGEEPPL